MSEQANKTVIGAFVVAAIALAAAAVVIFGGGKFFSEKRKWVMHFDGTVQGLSIGAPVELQGVKIGSVTGIDLELVVDRMEFRTKVYAETYGGIKPTGDPSAIKAFLSMGDNKDDTVQEDRFVAALIEKGMKARLATQSFVTGQLMVSLEFLPDEPVRLVGTEEGFREVPTVPTMMEQLEKNLESLPLKEIVTDLHDLVKGLRDLVESPALSKGVENLGRSSDELLAIMETLNEEIARLSPKMQDILGGVGRFVENLGNQMDPLASGVDEGLQEATRLMRRINERIDPLAENLDGLIQDGRTLTANVNRQLEGLEPDLKETMKSARESVERANQALAALGGFTPDDSALVHEVLNSVRSMSSAMDSLKTMAETLERKPEALIRGK